MRPCETRWAGQPVHAACDECDHALVAHRFSDHVCSVCEAVAAVREDRRYGSTS